MIISAINQHLTDQQQKTKYNSQKISITTRGLGNKAISRHLVVLLDAVHEHRQWSSGELVLFLGVIRRHALCVNAAHDKK